MMISAIWPEKKRFLPLYHYSKKALPKQCFFVSFGENLRIFPLFLRFFALFWTFEILLQFPYAAAGEHLRPGRRHWLGSGFHRP